MLLSRHGSSDAAFLHLRAGRRVILETGVVEAFSHFLEKTYFYHRSPSRVDQIASRAFSQSWRAHVFSHSLALQY
jgi:hypothetical protein